MSNVRAHHQSRGFTLVEVLLSLALLGIIMPLIYQLLVDDLERERVNQNRRENAVLAIALGQRIREEVLLAHQARLESPRELVLTRADGAERRFSLNPESHEIALREAAGSRTIARNAADVQWSVSLDGVTPLVRWRLRLETPGPRHRGQLTRADNSGAVALRGVKP